MALHGEQRLRNALRAVQRDLEVAAGPAAEAGAKVIIERARPPRATGALAASARVESSGNTASATFAAPYAAFVERGTRKMSAQPFLGPASEDHAAVVAAMAAVLKAAALRGRR